MVSAVRPAASRLPSQTTPLIGREAEVAALISLIHDPEIRLISLLAPGGMGKTRLALEVAAQVGGEFEHGAVFIALNAVSAPEHLVSTVANAVGVTLAGQFDPKEQLLEHFRKRQVLLIFDNFEHLLDAAPLLTEILQTAPRVKILATSRERLNLSSETLFPLTGLDFPPARGAGDMLGYSAVHLFARAARRTQLSADYSARGLGAGRAHLPLGAGDAAGDPAGGVVDGTAESRRDRRRGRAKESTFWRASGATCRSASAASAPCSSSRGGG